MIDRRERMVVVTMRVPRGMRDDVRAIAKANNVTSVDVFRSAVKHFLAINGYKKESINDTGGSK